MADKDNRLGKAKPLSGSPIIRSDKLGAADLDDLYRFSLSGKSSLDLGLANVKNANFDVEVYGLKVPLNQIPKKTRDLDFRLLKGDRNKYLRLVGASRKPGAVESIKTELAAGDYLVRVLRRKGDSKYRLNLTTTLVPTGGGGGNGGNGGGGGGGGSTDENSPTLLGNSIGTAYDTTIPTTTPIAGTVKDSAREDYYKFTLSQAGTFTFNASNFQNNADLQFLDGSGNVIGTEALDAANPQTFEKSLNAGTYYLRIFQEAAGDATSYSLTAASKIITPQPSDDGFDTNATKTLATTGSTTIDGQVADNDKQDFVKLTVSQTGDYRFSLGGLTGNADVQFFDSNQQQIASTYKADRPAFIQPLDQGTYYLKVYQRSAGKIADYNLTASLQVDGVSNTAETATVITDDLTTDLSTIKRNYVVDKGKKSFIDYYEFEVDEISKFTAELKDMSGNLDVRLLNKNAVATDLDKETPYDSPSIDSQLVFPGALRKGTYILQVFAPTGEGSTYELKASLDSTDGKPYMVANINNAIEGNSSSSPKNLVEVGNATFFVATTKEGETALYRTTGTADELKRIRKFDSVVDFTLATEDAFYFVADGGSGNELWQCDDSGEVKAITNFTGAAPDIFTTNMVAVGNYFYFTANEGEGAKLYRADLSSAQPSVDSSFAGTQLLADNISSMTVASGALFFAGGESGTGQKQLWRIKEAGTANATAPEKIGLNVNGASGPTEITDVGNNTLYLVAERGTKTELVKLENILGALDDLTNDDGLKATNITRDANGIPERLFLFQGGDGPADDILYFVANANDGIDDPKGRELMKIENPLAATASTAFTLVKDINPDGGSLPSDFVEFNNRLYFIADDGTDRKLWYTDATQGALSIDQGLLDPTDATSGVPYGFGSSLTVVGNTLYLVANSQSDTEINTGLELWQIDALNEMSLVEDINILTTTSPDTTNDASPTQLTTIGTSLYFIADDGVNGSEVWTVTPVDEG